MDSSILSLTSCFLSSGSVASVALRRLPLRRNNGEGGEAGEPTEESPLVLVWVPTESDLTSFCPFLYILLLFMDIYVPSSPTFTVGVCSPPVPSPASPASPFTREQCILHLTLNPLPTFFKFNGSKV